MIVWGLFEIAVTAVGAYNVIKGAYNMYCDAGAIKQEYRQHQRTTEEYRRAQSNKRNPLTESQYERYEEEFIVLRRSTILDPYKHPVPALESNEDSDEEPGEE